MDAPIDNVSKKNSEMVVYRDNPKPLVAFNEELVLGALSWTTKLQYHLASQLGFNVVQISDLPAPLKKIFSIMELIPDELFQGECLAESRQIVQGMVDQKRAEETRKLTYAGVKNRDQLKRKEEKVSQLIDTAKIQYLSNPCNVQSRLNIDLALVKAKFGYISADHESVLNTYWDLVQSNPALSKDSDSICSGALMMLLMNALDDVSDQVGKKLETNPIISAIAFYETAKNRIIAELIAKREDCESFADKALHNYAILKFETTFSALRWEILKKTFMPQISRAEEALAGFTKFHRGIAESNVVLFKQFIDRDEKELVKDLKRVRRVQDSFNATLDDLAENISLAANIDLPAYYRLIKSTFKCIKNEQYSVEMYHSFVDVRIKSIKRNQEYLREYEGRTEAQFQASALETLKYEGILNPIEAREIFATQTDGEKTIFKALMIESPFYENLVNPAAIPLLEEMRGDIVTDVEAYVKLYEERDQRILALFSSAKVVEILE